MNNVLFKIKALVYLLLCTSLSTFAQVTVGSDVPPEPAALLDVKNRDGQEGQVSSTMGGVLMPRVEISDVQSLNAFPELKGVDLSSAIQKNRHIGLMVYNITNDADKNLEEGVYVWNGERWEKSSYSQRVNFFYMPSVVIPTSTIGEQKTLDLYKLYQEQFSSPKVSSEGAPAQIPFFVSPDQLYYYVTDFDPNVFDPSSIKITANGEMSYSILKAATDGTSFINIVFVVK